MQCITLSVCLALSLPEIEVRRLGAPFASNSSTYNNGAGCRGKTADTRTCTFPSYTVEVLPAWSTVPLEGQRVPALHQLVRGAEEAQRQIQADMQKTHHTPGFFCYALRQALHSIGCSEPAPAPDWGGYSDVGKHTNVQKPATNWPLVSNVLRMLLSEHVRSHAHDSHRVAPLTCPQASASAAALPCQPIPPAYAYSSSG